VGVPREYFEEPLDPQVEQAVRRAIDLLGEMVATVVEVSWPMYKRAGAISTAILMAEATAYHSKLVRSRGSQMDPNVRMRIEAGFFISAADYIQAQQARTLFDRQSRDLFNNVDILAGPTEPVTAPRIGSTSVQIGDATVGSTAALTQYTRAFNLNGFPAVTVPCGFSDDGLPIGLQLAGKPFDESTVLKAAHTYETNNEWHKRRPPV
jgi:aspartyl-tRNA(Asn)/glutamyl-tRNA(Gln) amidotransferase subunit A